MQRLEGVYPILPTPYAEDGKIAFKDIENMCEFAVLSKVQGVVVNEFGSEAEFMLDEEREQIVETVSKTLNGRLPFIAAINTVSITRMVEFARHAKEHGAAALIASAPFMKEFKWPDVRERGFAELNKLELPIILEDNSNAHVTMGLERKKELMVRFPYVQYVKVDGMYLHSRACDTIAACASAAPESFCGAIAGLDGYDMVNLYARGLRVFMPGLHVADLAEEMYQNLKAGRAEDAERIQYALGRLELMERMFVPDVMKEILRRRNVISCTGHCSVGLAYLDETGVEEVGRIYDSLKKRLPFAHL